MSGKYKAVASGTIANGKPVIVNSTGTVTQVAQTSISQQFGSDVLFNSSNESSYITNVYDSNSNKVVTLYINQDGSNDGTANVGTIDTSDNSISYGSAGEYTTNFGFYNSSTFDSNSNKVVQVYADNGNSNYGTAAVGTVSGTDITFGTPVVFESAAIGHFTATTFDTNSNKVVIAFKGTSNYGRAIVGTVSGTGISFGSVANFDTGNTNWMASTFDSNENKVVISYKDGNNSGYGTAIVGTVSSTSISFGTAVVFNSASTEKQGATFDSNSNKVVLCYQDQGNSNKGTAIVGTVSGTGISFGSEAIFEEGETEEIAAVFDTSINKIVVAFIDRGDNNGAGKVNVGTVSGTSISFGTAITFESAYTTNNARGIALAYDVNANRSVVSWKDSANSDRGTTAVYQAASTPSNVTSENYIGLSNACSFHGATETYTVTVASGALYGGGGTGNVFYLNGLSNPPIQLLKGHTYIFDQADSSNSGHPLHFKDTGGSQYTSGVTVTGTAGQAGAKVTIVVPIDATEPSQYYCTAHGNGMGNLVTIEESFAEIDVVGTVNKHQSGLTAGQTYFVQTDGTLGTSADDPSVVAGTAISATEIIVKG